MAILLHTFAAPVRLTVVYSADWTKILKDNNYGSEFVPAGRWDKLSDGKRKSVLCTFNIAPENTVGRLDVYTRVDAQLTREAESSKEKEILSAEIPVNAEHPFAPVYQPGEGIEVFVSALVEYKKNADVRTEDLRVLQAAVPV